MAIYKVKKIKKNIQNINELMVSEFLIEGNDKALLLDTGMDIFNIKKFILGLTDKELIVVNSHFHPDHSNGNRKFKKVLIGENDLPTFTNEDPYFALVNAISKGVYREYPKSRLLMPLIKKVFMTKKGKTKYEPLKDGDKIDLGKRELIVKDFPGHTPGSITLLDKKNKLILMGDSCNMATWMFTNPDCSLHEYANTARSYYTDVKSEGFKKMLGSHEPFAHKINFIYDYANWVDKLTPEKALKQFNLPGTKSPLCIAVKPNLKHGIFACLYFAHQCEDIK
ncbi:MAG: MBL fold metallo-hydrolase [Oscillospiraceae bacterium]|nr:MBL fold metallo-hydrolase [Oscillospiraceae bacterium]